MRKAYNTMDWDFIQDMLIALSFLAHFRKIVIVFISSTKYSLLINGCPSEVFHPKRGLKQGDPLCPLLFVIGMEYLSDVKFHPRCKRLNLKHLNHLVSSVLMSISSYWCQLFILPKYVIRTLMSSVEHICGMLTPIILLQEGLTGMTFCKPKKKGGLGIRNLGLWFEIAIAKLAPHVHNMTEISLSSLDSWNIRQRGRLDEI